MINYEKIKKLENKPSKPCECSLCLQFIFSRNQIHKYKKNCKQKELQIEQNNINTNTYNKKNDDAKYSNSNKDDEVSNENKNFTVNDLDRITHLKSLDFNTEEISKQTNLSHLVVDYIINMIYQQT